jgi:hypothetical protein
MSAMDLSEDKVMQLLAQARHGTALLGDGQ